jgi:hypothetical protein
MSAVTSRTVTSQVAAEHARSNAATVLCSNWRRGDAEARHVLRAHMISDPLGSRSAGLL